MSYKIVHNVYGNCTSIKLGDGWGKIGFISNTYITPSSGIITGSFIYDFTSPPVVIV